jgi:hypothetical protein
MWAFFLSKNQLQYHARMELTVKTRLFYKHSLPQARSYKVALGLPGAEEEICQLNFLIKSTLRYTFLSLRTLSRRLRTQARCSMEFAANWNSKRRREKNETPMSPDPPKIFAIEHLNGQKNGTLPHDAHKFLVSTIR